MQMYDIIRKEGEGGKVCCRPVTPECQEEEEKSAFITDVTPNIEKDQQVTVKKLAMAYGVWMTVVHNTLHQDFNLSKKSARCISKLLTYDMKKGRVRKSEAFLVMVCHRCMATLDSIVIMEESTLYFSPSEIKKQSK
jgi:hypothetical protein